MRGPEKRRQGLVENMEPKTLGIERKRKRTDKNPGESELDMGIRRPMCLGDLRC